VESESEKSDQSNQSKLAKKTTTPARKEDEESPHKDGLKQQTKTTKHTIEFSNNTPGFQATLPLYSILAVWSILVRRCF
jgi:hypothetical protein